MIVPIFVIQRKHGRLPCGDRASLNVQFYVFSSTYRSFFLSSNFENPLLATFPLRYYFHPVITFYLFSKLIWLFQEWQQKRQSTSGGERDWQDVQSFLEKGSWFQCLGAILTLPKFWKLWTSCSCFVHYITWKTESTHAHTHTHTHTERERERETKTHRHTGGRADSVSML